MINIVFVQSMAELLAENYHNIWARKKKIELEAKGKCNTTHSQCVFACSNTTKMKHSMHQCVYARNTNHDEKQFV